MRQKNFQFKEQNYLQTHGTTMVTEKTIAFTSIFMAKIATQIFDRSAKKLLICCNIDNTISLLHTNRDAVNQFIEQT